MQDILLDRYGDARVPSGYELIDTEVAFLRYATVEGKWFIRGQRLCEWAESFFTGRNTPVQDALSPCRTLQKAIPTLSQEQAAELSVRLGECFYDLDPVNAQTVAQALYQHTLWQSDPSWRHAAEWLLWLDLQTLNETDHCLLHVVTSRWVQQAPEELKRVYETIHAEASRRILDSWLGILPDESLAGLGEFPIDVPPRWLQKAAEVWRHCIIQTQGACVEQLLRHPMPLALKEVVGKEAATYFRKNHEHLTEEHLARLAPCLERRQWGQLRKLLSPSKPSDIPERPEDVLQWFRDEYLPYREWQWRTNDQQAQQHSLDLAKRFAEWYLKFYPQALVSGKSGKHLSIFHVGALKQDETKYVTLLILLDGLHLMDAQQLLQALRKETRHLAIREDLVFAPLPTVTQFAKEALLRAVPPRDVSEVPLLAEDISERKSPIERLEAAQAGELLIWRIQEPDHTYHARNTSETLERDIEGQLNTIARKVVDIVEQLPARVPLQLVVTTDHGRLLGTSRRNVPIPPGMEAHGRAAWGPTGKVFPQAGYTLDGNLAYLCGDRYGLPVDAAVILNEDAFHTNDDKQGQEKFAHGGLFPEEVIVPWIVLERDAVHGARSITASITGKGKAGQPGTASVRITNHNEVPLILRSVRITLGGESRSESFEAEISALSESIVTLELAPWPSKADLRHADASVVVCWPHGEPVEVSAVVELNSEEMYSRDISLLEELDL